jgi:hypothetical protein
MKQIAVTVGVPSVECTFLDFSNNGTAGLNPLIAKLSSLRLIFIVYCAHYCVVFTQNTRLGSSVCFISRNTEQMILVKFADGNLRQKLLCEGNFISYGIT